MEEYLIRVAMLSHDDTNFLLRSLLAATIKTDASVDRFLPNRLSPTYGDDSIDEADIEQMQEQAVGQLKSFMATLFSDEERKKANGR